MRSTPPLHICAVALLLLLFACAPIPPTALPTSTPVLPSPTCTLTPTPTPTPTPSDLYLTTDDVVLYPGPDLYSGDIVTFDVIPRNLGQLNPHEVAVRVLRQIPDGAEVIAEGEVGYPAFDNVPRARLVWAWDTAGLWGEETLTVWLDPDDRIQEGDEDPENNIITFTIRLLPATDRSPVEVAATWATTATDCCVLHYLTDTAAERDLPIIAAMAERAVDHVQEQVGARLDNPFEIYLISRVIGHGGYAYQGLTLSYLDRHYAGHDLETVIRHEATHVVDLEMLTEWSPALVREGLAVWVAGGHFKPEPIPQRAAALVQLGWYIPLEQLADDFYRQQHEIGYLEGAAFVAYLVEAYGWTDFLHFYSSFDSSYESAAEILDAALTETFNVGLAETERAFLRWVEEHPPTQEEARDLQVTVRLFETVRRYQEMYDPSAYFRSGWLPNPAEAEPRRIVADFLRHPRTAENIALETMLIAAEEALRAGSYDRAEVLLDGVNRVLEEGSFAGPPAEDYLTVVRATAAAGYEAQRIALEETTARVWAIGEWPALTELTLRHTAAGWALGD